MRIPLALDMLIISTSKTDFKGRLIMTIYTCYTTYMYSGVLKP